MIPIGTVFTAEQPGNTTANIMVFVCTIVAVFFIVLTYMVVRDRSINRRIIRSSKVSGFAFIVCSSIAFMSIVSTFCYAAVSSSGGPSVEGVVSKVASTPDGPVVVFDDGKSVSAAGYIDELKDLTGLRVRFSCYSNWTKSDGFESINRCEYDKIVSDSSSKHNSN